MPGAILTDRQRIAWLRLHAHGRAGHGSVPNDESSIVRLTEAIARIDAHPWPRTYIASVRELFDGGLVTYDGKPVTLRNVMTHTTGMEEAIRGLIANDDRQRRRSDQPVVGNVPAGMA